MKTVWAAVLVCTFIAVSAHCGFAQSEGEKSGHSENAEAKPFQAFLSELDTELESLKTSESEFVELYKGHLTKLEAEVRKTGDLKKVLLVQDELKTFKEDKARDYEALPELQKLRSVYETKIAEVHAKMETDRNALLRTYYGKLEGLKRDKTKAGEIEVALSIDTEQKRVAGLITSPQEAAKQDPDPAADSAIPGSWAWKTVDDITRHGGPIVQQKEDGWWRLEKGAGTNTFVLTKNTFSPPFVFSATLTPENDSEVRFGSPAGFLVHFNGGGDGETLTLWSPKSPGEAFTGKGELKKGDSHDIEIRIYKDRIEVRVDKRVRGKLKGDFSQFTERVGFSPFRACPILVKDMKAVPLEEDK